MKLVPTCIVASLLFCACRMSSSDAEAGLKPSVVTAKVFRDSDDPAIWVDDFDPSRSIVIGTDKDSGNGGLYVFGLDGRIDTVRTVTGLKRMNNVDVAYGLGGGDTSIDVAVATERVKNRIRVFRLPDMKAVDSGGIEVFVGQADRDPMGIATYKRPSDGTVFAIVGRKSGPTEGYLEQYLLTYDGRGSVRASLVRRFGRYSGRKEIESIAVDAKLGFVYFSDEQYGVRKYFADPEKGDGELTVFGQGDFKEDNEGISVYELTDSTGYIIVSDQSANRFNVYPREGEQGKPHFHRRIASIPLSTKESDGSEVTSLSLPGFEGGLFVAMSDDGTFHYYRWVEMARRAGLAVRPDGRRSQ